MVRLLQRAQEIWEMQESANYESFDRSRGGRRTYTLVLNLFALSIKTLRGSCLKCGYALP